MRTIYNNLSADVVLASQRGLMTSGGPRPGMGTDYGSTEQRYTRFPGVARRDGWPTFRPGQGFVTVPFDQMSVMGRPQNVFGPWAGVKPQSKMQITSRLGIAPMRKVPS